MFRIFKKTKELQRKIDQFFDTIIEASLEFKQGMKYYIDNNKEDFENKVKQVDDLEGKADNFRREIENRLYSEMLIPEARGDVLAILENSDNVLNLLADIMVEFSIEKPEFPEEIIDNLKDLVEVCIKSVEEMIETIRAYFSNAVSVKTHITRVMFYEKESDKIGEKIKKTIFNNKKIKLSRKIHLRTFITYLLNIADMSEDIGDRVSIYAVKRRM